MTELYTIGKLARAAGVPTTTVRFYERRGLLVPDRRSDGNYRVYGPATLDRLRFIRVAQANGFTLRDIVALLDLADGEARPFKQVQRLIGKRLADVDRRIGELRQIRRVLHSWLARCRQSTRSGRCAVIVGLKAGHPRRP